MGYIIEDITLKPFSDEDLDIFRVWIDKEYIYKWLCPDGEEEKVAWIDEIIFRDTEFHYLKHFIVYCKDVKIGFCLHAEAFYLKEHYGDLPDIEHTYEIGYFIGVEEYLNKGIGKMIVKKIEEKIIEIGGKQILADPSEENVVSIKTLLSNGFTKHKDCDYRKVLYK